VAVLAPIPGAVLLPLRARSRTLGALLPTLPPPELRPAHSVPCAVMVLRCMGGGRRATKTWRRKKRGWELAESYQAGKYFEAEERPVHNVYDLARVLTDLQSDPRAFLVRGRLTKGRTDARRVRRQYLPVEAAFARTDRQWLFIDLDDAPAPLWLNPAEPESLHQAVSWAVTTYLPAEFHGAACWYQWSSSAGCKPWGVLRLHLAYWLNRPVCCPSVKAWLAPLPYLDGALYQPVQPHYVAAPRFLGGAVDPLAGCRCGLLPGRADLSPPSEVVGLKIWEAAEAEAEEKRRRVALKRLRSVEAGELRLMPRGDAQAYGEAALVMACADIEDAAPGKRNQTTFQRARQIFGMVQAGILDADTAYRKLEAAALAVLKAEPEARRRGIPGILKWAQDHAEPFDLADLATVPSIPLAEAEEQLSALFDAAMSYAAGAPGRVAVLVCPLGLGKTHEALRRLALERGRGTFLAVSHGDLDEREGDAAEHGLIHRRRWGLTTAPGPDGNPICRHVRAVEAAGRRGYSPRNAVCPACQDRENYDGTGKPCRAYNPRKSRRRQTLLTVQAIAPYLGKELCPPVIVDELPALLLKRTLTPEDLAAVTTEHTDPRLAEWCEPLAPLARLVVRACRCLARLPRRSRYGDRVSGRELAELLRLAAAEGQQRTFGSDRDTEGREELTAALRALPAAPREKGPPYPRNRTTAATWAETLRGDLDALLLAVAEEVRAAEPDLIPRPDRQRSAWASLAARGGAVRLEVQTRPLDGWKLPDKPAADIPGERAADITPVPGSYVLLDATGARTEAAARGALPGREVRLFTMPPVAEAAGAVSRLFVRTGALVRRSLLHPDGELTDRGIKALARILRNLGRRLARTGEGQSLGVITHMPAAALLRDCGEALDGCTEAGERVAAAGGAPVLEALHTWREARRVGGLVIGHFGAVRGSNEFKKLDALAVLGTPWANIGAVEEDARALGVDAQAYGEGIAQAELEQALGRAREIRRTADEPVPLVHFAKEPPDCWKGRRYSVDALPKGGPAKSEAAEDAADLAAAVIEEWGACCAPFLRLIFEKPELLRRVHGADRTAIEIPILNSSCVRSIAALPDRELRRAVSCTLSHLPEARTSNPVRTGKAPGYWPWREVRPGAAAKLAEALRLALTKEE